MPRVFTTSGCRSGSKRKMIWLRKREILFERRGHVLRETRVVGVVQAIVAGRGRVSGAVDPRKVERARSE